MSDENLPATRAPLAASGGAVTAIIPRDIDQMFRLANAMHISGLSPSTLKSPEQVMIAIMAGAELGLPPFQSVQSFAVINGRPCLFGDGLLAVVRASGFRVREWQEGEGDGVIAHCEVTRPDNGETVKGDFSVSDAKRASLWGKTGPWQQYPKRMLKMRARAFALRDGAADVLRGFQLREEVEDYQDARVEVVEQSKGSGLAARLTAQPAQAAGFNAESVAAQTEPKPRGRPRKAADPAPVNDAAPVAEPATASQGAAETVDQETGEIVDAVVEEIAQDDDFPGDRPRPTETASAQSAEPGQATSESATPASTGSAEATSGPSVDDAPYTEMAEAMQSAAHWLAIKQVFKKYAKTDAWQDLKFRAAALQTGWRRFSDLQNGGAEDTEVFSDYALFQLWLEYGAASAAQIDAFWPTFYRGVYTKASEDDQKKVNELRARRKEALG